MAGYDGYSKSKNALKAEEEGFMTLTNLAKLLKCKSNQIKGVLEPDEWHHTSKFYNKTNYYDANPFITLINDKFIYKSNNWDSREDFDTALEKYNKIKSHKPYKYLIYTFTQSELEDFIKKNKLEKLEIDDVYTHLKNKQGDVVGQFYLLRRINKYHVDFKKYI